MAGSLENRGKLRELIDKFQFDGVTNSSLSITGDIERDSPFKVLALSKVPF